MPFLHLVSNVQPSDARAFIKEFSKLASETLGKPEKAVAIDFRYNESLSFGGTFEPAFLLTIGSLINVNPETNAEFSGVFFAFFKEKLGISGERGFIEFVDPTAAYIGYDGTTIAKMWEKAGVKH
ncbi:Tautomerase/MIF [Auricularia subglabra TFB-10046 SS5]|uniref:L-dopachrome isomerase n=1 Tax=Auricularia subglabra (strain TFB-10046 / SS5) TaxID=717982 RepID=J0LHZ8_AURST|nr:Tautomerase/MIF [Auricularia subglabra TFB-10046 SS5]